MGSRTHHEFQAECRRYFEDVRAKRRDPADLPADLRSKGLDIDAPELAALQAIDAQISAWETRGRVALADLTSAEAIEDYANSIEAHGDAQTEALDLSRETFRRALTEFLGLSRMNAAQVPARDSTSRHAPETSRSR